MPSTCKATHSLLKFSLNTPQFGQFGGPAGVCVSICVCLHARAVDCTCVPACMCMCMTERVYVEGVAMRSWKVLKVGVLVVGGVALIWLGVKKCPQVS